MENHHFLLENPLFQWPFSIAMLNYQRVYEMLFTHLLRSFLDPPISTRPAVQGARSAAAPWPFR